MRTTARHIPVNAIPLWVLSIGVIGFNVLSSLFGQWFSKAWAEAIAFFLAYGCFSLILFWKQPNNKMRWGMICPWLIGSIGIYGLDQFPEQKAIIWSGMAVMIAASLLVVWAISKRNNMKGEER